MPSCSLLILLLLVALLPGKAGANERPNILWLHAEDMSPLLGCYGWNVSTPVLDRFAKEGILFERCYTPTPVCSTCRSSLMLGAYATTYGAHQHRSSTTKESAIALPEGIRTLSELLREAGYYTFNVGGKLDFNFVHDRKAMFDYPGANRTFYRPGVELPWEKRKPGQPFFGMIQLQAGKESRERKEPTDPGIVRLPSYYPDHPAVRAFFAYQYDAARTMDDDVRTILDALKKDGLGDNTVVIFHGDHGMRAVRDKQFCYDGGLHVPLLIRWPANPSLVPPGTRRKEIVANLDVTGTTLALAGVPIPEFMECQSLLGESYTARPYVIGVRDRCDFTIDRIRTVRSDRYRYVRNFLTDRPYTQSNYKDFHRELKPGGIFEHILVMKRLYREGKLNERQAWFWAPERPPEELYDHETDPDETINLAGDPKYEEILKEHRKVLEEWIAQTGDQGQVPESDASLRAVVKRWRDKCINPEYDRVKGK